MSTRIYMRVIVENESDAVLRLQHESTSGDWTPGGWAPSQSAQTLPGASLAWQAEGDTIAGAVPVSGVEARVWYDVIGPGGTVVGQLYIFANCPLIESQYGNTFHVHAPPGYYADYVDAEGQKHGNRAILTIRFRTTSKVAVAGFLPSRNGFQFANRWDGSLPVVTVGFIWNRLLDAMSGDLADLLGIAHVSEDWLPVTHADGGLCGGMVYAAMDYFNARQLPPPATYKLVTPPGVMQAVSPDSASDPLFQYTRQRLLDSFDFNGRGARWLAYSSPVYPDDDEGVLQSAGVAKGKAWVTYREEWPRIRALLDRGQLAPVGLVQSAQFDVGANHQVLAYAYRQSGQVVQLWIYDPNVPKQADAPAVADDLYLEFDTTNTADGITVIRRNARPKDYEKRIYAILYMDNYQPHVAPLGQAVPPPGKPRRVELTIGDAESFTTGGTATSERTNACGDIIRVGRWTSRTTASFVAQVSGFVDPKLSWSLDGVPLAPGATSFAFARGGTNFSVGCQFDAGGRTLTLSSASGDTYQLPVAVDVTDVLGNAKRGDARFEIEGSYEGLRLEDIRAETQCIARNIPVPADIGVFIMPKPGPVEAPGVDIVQWQQQTLDRLQNDRSFTPSSRDALRDFVNVQVERPEFRLPGLDAARFRGPG